MASLQSRIDELGELTWDGEPVWCPDTVGEARALGVALPLFAAEAFAQLRGQTALEIDDEGDDVMTVVSETMQVRVTRASGERAFAGVCFSFAGVTARRAAELAADACASLGVTDVDCFEVFDEQGCVRYIRYEVIA